MWHIPDESDKFIEALVRTDIEEAEKVRKQRCECGGRLHRANYPRKARGVPDKWADHFSQRYSFCCAERKCRKRRTPPSVRFMWRRVYIAMVVIACSAQCATDKVEEVPVRTVGRWKRWFQEAFTQTDFWRGEKARFMPPVREEELPRSLVERFPGDALEKVCQTVTFLAQASFSWARKMMEE